jgi:predicted ArsR family transcriptional regulator
LEQRGSASAQQLAQALGQTPANLRRHLSILAARGLVARISFVPTAGRGRPVALYALTASAQGASLEPLARALLTSLAADSGSVESHAAQMAQNLLGATPPPSGQLTRRLVAAVQRLAPLNYKPRWEAKPHGPEVVLGRCPYAALVADHPELCRMDAHLLSNLLGVAIEQTAKLVPGPHAIPQCVFKLQRNANS